VTFAPAPQLLDRSLETLLRRAGALEQLACLTAVRGQSKQQVLGGDVGVLHLLGDLEGLREDVKFVPSRVLPRTASGPVRATQHLLGGLELRADALEFALQLYDSDHAREIHAFFLRELLNETQTVDIGLRVQPRIACGTFWANQ
jgi:hypothetical protein